MALLHRRIRFWRVRGTSYAVRRQQDPVPTRPRFSLIRHNANHADQIKRSRTANGMNQQQVIMNKSAQWQFRNNVAKEDQVKYMSAAKPLRADGPSRLIPGKNLVRDKALA